MLGRKHFLIHTTFYLAFFIFFIGVLPLKAEKDFNALQGDEISMIRGDLETIRVKDLKRVSITNPEVADIVNIEDKGILMIAKEAGQTTLFIWDNFGKRSVTIYVANDDLNMIKNRIQEILAKSYVEDVFLDVNSIEGKVVVSGEFSSSKKEEVEKLLEPFEDNVLNLVREKEEEDLIQIDAQIVELNASETKQLGIDWTSALTYTETLPSGTVHDFPDLFKLGKFARTTKILSTLNLLIQEGKGKVLSKPKLVCLSGKEASFLVGGEVPITKNTTSSGGNVQQNVEFKDFGVGLTIRPTIKEHERINIGLEIEVSDLDAANSSGGQPAFTTRNAQTELYLDNGQTVVLAGLIKSSKSSTVRKVPLLGDIPIVGAFFRSKKNTVPDTETELVITLTPTILPQSRKAYSQTQVSTSDLEMAEEYADNSFSPTTADVSDQALKTKIFISPEMMPYLQSLQDAIAQRIVYPEKARRYGWEGTVKLALHIFNDGTLASASVRESSGYDLFDEDALNLIKNLAPYSAFPSDTNLQELTVTVPIVYNLDGGL